jgi:hypothetical protein
MGRSVARPVPSIFFVEEFLAGKAATSSLFLIPAGENFYLQS